MSVPALALKPAIDARPPAELWAGLGVLQQPAPPSQPPLGLCAEAEPEPMTAPPTPARVPIRVDTEPAGLAPDREPELAEQARTWAPWFAQLLAEALDGRRALEALGHWLDDWVLAEVSRRVRSQRRARTRTPSAPPPAPATVVSLRAQFSGPGVLEVAAHLRRGRRSHACAFRLVRVGDRWRCAALQLASR